MSQTSRVAVITGASSGIGEATARRLRRDGYEVWIGARRMDRLSRLAEEIGAHAEPLDVTDRASVDDFAASVPRCDVLVNNAGGAHGLAPIAQASEEHWRTMWESNVLGLMLVTRAFLPRLEESAGGHVVTIGSIAGFETYAGGAGYTGAKHAARAFSRTLRLELLGRRVRVTEIDPGLVETEFSLVRFGDPERARKVYEGYTPLRADDIADCVAWVVSRPWHVNVDEMVIRPVAQATATQVARDAGL